MPLHIRASPPNLNAFKCPGHPAGRPDRLHRAIFRKRRFAEGARSLRRTGSLPVRGRFDRGRLSGVLHDSCRGPSCAAPKADPKGSRHVLSRAPLSRRKGPGQRTVPTCIPGARHRLHQLRGQAGEHQRRVRPVQDRHGAEGHGRHGTLSPYDLRVLLRPVRRGPALQRRTLGHRRRGRLPLRTGRMGSTPSRTTATPRCRCCCSSHRELPGRSTSRRWRSTHSAAAKS